MPECLAALGANLGDRQSTLDAALADLSATPGVDLLRRSTWLETAPVGGPPDQPPFLNGVVALGTSLDPRQLLGVLQDIEDRHNRERFERWSARTLDIDLLTHGDAVSHQASLWLPHPRMTFRSFVMAPAVEVAARWTHPPTGRTLGELHAPLGAGAGTVAIVGDAADRVSGWLLRSAPGFTPCEPPRSIASSQETSCWLSLGFAAPGGGLPKLVIDAREAGAATRGALPAPTLMLAAAPPEEWEDEVAAALQCVWPGLTISPSGG